MCYQARPSPAYSVSPYLAHAVEEFGGIDRRRRWRWDGALFCRCRPLLNLWRLRGHWGYAQRMPFASLERWRSMGEVTRRRRGRVSALPAWGSSRRRKARRVRHFPHRGCVAFQLVEHLIWHRRVSHGHQVAIHFSLLMPPGVGARDRHTPDHGCGIDAKFDEDIDEPDTRAIDCLLFEACDAQRLLRLCDRNPRLS